jgi:hypothetical protein
MHMELITGGARVEAAAHRALSLLDSALTLAAEGDREVADELVARARDSLATGLGEPVRSSPRTDEEMAELSRDEQHIDDLAARAA